MRLGIKINPHSPVSRQALESVKALFQGKVECLKIYDEDAVKKQMYAVPVEEKAEIDLMIALGGDGTLLTTGRLAASLNIPVLGVNLGRFGFLTEVSLSELKDWVNPLLDGKYFLEERMTLRAETPPHQSYIAVNDFVIREVDYIKTAYFDFSVDGEAMEGIPADGVIVSTPTGSTAYNLSAGGSIIDPRVRALILTLICPHMLSVRPLVLPPTSEIVVKSKKESSLMVSVDGQYGLKIPPESQVKMTVSPYIFRLVRLKSFSFYTVLKKKLGWGAGRKEG